jgi:hypothetical protein
MELLLLSHHLSVSNEAATANQSAPEKEDSTIDDETFADLDEGIDEDSLIKHLPKPNNTGSIGLRSV